MNDIGVIHLTNGGFAIVDADLMPKVGHLRCANIGIYDKPKKDAIMATVKINGKWTLRPLSHFILDCPKGFEIDHANHFGIDNRRRNLRVCSRSQNVANTRKLPKKVGKWSSAFKGVHWQEDHGAWRVRVRDASTGKLRHVGYFKNEQDAADAYDKSAVERFGEFALTNKFCDETLTQTEKE